MIVDANGNPRTIRLAGLEPSGEVPPECIALDIPGLQSGAAERHRDIVDAGIRLLATTRAPSGPDDFKAGTLAVPLYLDWLRGPGRVNSVEPNGEVWVTFGPLPNMGGHSREIRVHATWCDLRIVPEEAPPQPSPQLPLLGPEWL